MKREISLNAKYCEAVKPFSTSEKLQRHIERITLLQEMLEEEESQVLQYMRQGLKAASC